MLFRRVPLRLLPFMFVAVLLAAGLVYQQDAVASQDVRGTPATVEQNDVPVVPQQQTSQQARQSTPEESGSPEVQTQGHGQEPAQELDHGFVVAKLTETKIKPFSMLGVTWKSGVAEDAGMALVEVRWRSEGTWSTWTELHQDPAPDQPGSAGSAGTEPYWVGEADAAAVRVLSRNKTRPVDLKLTTIDPGQTPGIESAGASVGQPTIIDRKSWGAAESDSCFSPIYGSTTQGAVVHHTAGSNTYTRNDSPKIVKSTQAYHMGARGWCDIGYNFLIDKYGQTFEGRAGGTTKPVRAAHAGNGAVNEMTMGVSLMGTFDRVEPSEQMKSALVTLIAWRLDQYKRPANGTFLAGGINLNRISGHRDVVSTACPGIKVYAWLSAKNGLRDRVAAALEPEPKISTGRIAGSDRFETAVEISRTYFKTNTSSVWVASSRDYPDALAAGPAAAHQDAPLLLVPPTGKIPKVVRDELTRLKPKSISVVGGPKSVSSSVEGQLSAYAGDVTRRSGADRYQTAATVFRSIGDVNTVFIASGTGFADALGGGATAARLGGGLLLTAPNKMPETTRAELKRSAPTRVVILGGNKSVSATVEAQIKKAAPKATLLRRGGKDRYATAVEVSKLGFPSSSDTVFLASGSAFPDALAGGTAVAQVARKPLLLTKPTCVPTSTQAEIRRLGASKVVALGGKTVISDTALNLTPCT